MNKKGRNSIFLEFLPFLFTLQLEILVLLKRICNMNQNKP